MVKLYCWFDLQNDLIWLDLNIFLLGLIWFDLEIFWPPVIWFDLICNKYKMIWFDLILEMIKWNDLISFERCRFVSTIGTAATKPGYNNRKHGENWYCCYKTSLQYLNRKHGQIHSMASIFYYFGGWMV